MADGMDMSGLLSGIGAFSASAQKMGVAGDQARKAEDLRRAAKLAKLQKVQQEYLDAEKNAKFRSLGDMAGFGATKEAIQASTPNIASTAGVTAKDNNEILAAVLSASNQANSQLNELNKANEEFKLKQAQYADNLGMKVAEEKKANLALQREERSRLQKAADALEKAATANKQQGIEGMITSAASMFGGGMMGGVGTGSPGTTKGMAATGTQPTPTPTDATATNATTPNDATQVVQAQVNLTPEDIATKDFSKETPENIRALQAYLKANGIDVGITGVYDPATEDAIQQAREARISQIKYAK